ncbi:M20 family metallo-hydrolase [[Eubacterium] cellulosolvens]
MKEFKAPDNRVPCKYRPNLVAKFYGDKRDQTLWIVTHIDVVPPGDSKLWRTNPFKMCYKNRKLIGRGVEDNQQELVASVLAAKALRDLKITPKCNLGLVMVSDEETGSEKGLQYILKQHKNVFSKSDLFIVPDFGNPEGTMIEVAEKTILWLKFEVIGRQAHGSRPDLAINSHKISSYLITRLDTLHTKFNLSDPLFDLPGCSFEPTKIESGVSNINTIPGRHIFYLDCRINPKIKVEKVLKEIMIRVNCVEKEYKVEIKVNPVYVNRAAPTTSPQSPVVKILSRSIKEVAGKIPTVVGLGGGTLAAFLRKEGFDAVVWSTIGETAHQPNEFCSIDNLINDAKVYLHMIL